VEKKKEMSEDQFGRRGDKMIKLKDILSEGKLNEKTGGSRTYKSLMKLERGIKELERDFNRDKRDMDSDRARNVKKSIGNIKQSWTAIWADFQER
jgi:hypothetical protein